MMLPPKTFSERYRKAKWWKQFRNNVHQVIDGIFYTFLTGYELPKNSRWTLFAQMFWIECPICFFYRGATFGFLLAAMLATLLFVVVC
jgi:hypothetical protein